LIGWSSNLPYMYKFLLVLGEFVIANTYNVLLYYFEANYNTYSSIITLLVLGIKVTAIQDNRSQLKRTPHQIITEFISPWQQINPAITDCSKSDRKFDCRRNQKMTGSTTCATIDHSYDR
jgi:hypothetical protein